MNIKDQQTLDLLIRKLIKSVHEDATEADLDSLVDDFHYDFINTTCRESINLWHSDEELLAN